jgi:hypothetical protein
MPERNARFETFLIVRTAKTAGVGQLKADDEIVDCSVVLPVSVEQSLTQLCDSFLILAREDQLIRIGAPIRTNGHRFAAVDHLSAAFAESRPTAEHVVCDPAGGRSIPTFHWLNGDAIANCLSTDLHSGTRLRNR